MSAIFLDHHPNYLPSLEDKVTFCLCQFYQAGTTSKMETMFNPKHLAFSVYCETKDQASLDVNENHKFSLYSKIHLQ